MNSVTDSPARAIWSRRRPGASSLWSGIERDITDPSRTRTWWLPRMRATRQPARSSARIVSAPETRGSLGTRGDLDLPCLDGQGKPLFLPDLEAKLDSLTDVRQGLFFGAALTGTSRDRRTTDDEPAVVIDIESYRQLHRAILPSISRAQGIETANVPMAAARANLAAHISPNRSFPCLGRRSRSLAPE